MAPAQFTAPNPGVPPIRQGTLGRIPARQALEAIGYGLFALMILLIGIDVSQPAPYDFVALPVILYWLALGLRVPRQGVFFVGLLLIYLVGIFLATVPHFDKPDSPPWAVISVYLVMTTIFFMMFFSDETHYRLELALTAFLASSLIAAVAGIMGYFDILGTYAIFTDEERAMGTFRDPNVFGSFLILPVFFLIRDLITGEGQRPLLGFVLLPVLLAGVFLAFSRGTWSVTIIGTVVLIGMTFWTSRSVRVRRRIVLLSVVTGILATGSIVGLLAMEGVQSMFEERAHIVQPYDAGETGRFGQHLRAIPALLDRPNGFGPMRYKYMFRFDPHNSYLNSFASGGWIGGLAFLGLVLSTTFVGLRLALRPSPYQRHAQIFFAAHLTLVLQSFQIDVDHWRQVYLIWGAIWGLEVARVRWLASQRGAVAAAQALPRRVPAVGMVESR
jgi:O-antigen ligase